MRFSDRCSSQMECRNSCILLLIVILCRSFVARVILALKKVQWHFVAFVSFGLFVPLETGSVSGKHDCYMLRSRYVSILFQTCVIPAVCTHAMPAACCLMPDWALADQIISPDTSKWWRKGNRHADDELDIYSALPRAYVYIHSIPFQCLVEGSWGVPATLNLTCRCITHS